MCNELQALKSDFAHERSRTKDLESQVKNLELRTKTSEEDAVTMRNDIYYIKYSHDQERGETKRLGFRLRDLEYLNKWTTEKCYEIKALERHYRNIKNASTRLQRRIEEFQLRLKSLESHSLKAKSDAELENRDLETNEDFIEERIEDHSEEKPQRSVRHEEPVEYSPESHLRYVRQIEEKFGFQFEDHALVWQALQWKRHHAITARLKFNKLLALEGDAVLRLTLITKAIQQDKIEFLTDWLNHLQANKHLLRVALTMGLDKLTFSSAASGLFTPVDVTATNLERVLGTTMEAIFALIHRQGGTSAVDNALEFIGFFENGGQIKSATKAREDRGQLLSEFQEVREETGFKVMEPIRRAESSNPEEPRILHVVSTFDDVQVDQP